MTYTNKYTIIGLKYIAICTQQTEFLLFLNIILKHFEKYDMNRH